MKIPGLDQIISDLDKRGNDMQETLEDIRALLIQIEENTRLTGIDEHRNSNHE